MGRVGDVGQAQAPVEEEVSTPSSVPEVLVPALPFSVIEPLWDQFVALLPQHVDTHPLGCHNPRISDRVVFDKLVQVAVLGAAYERIADARCSATTIRRRRDEWIAAGVFESLEQAALEAYDRFVGLDLHSVAVDGCIVKAPCGGEAAGKSPVDRGKQGTKRSLMVDGAGVPIGCVVTAPTGATRPPCARPWRGWAGSTTAWASGCPSRSPCTWTPDTTTHPLAPCSPSSAAAP